MKQISAQFAADLASEEMPRATCLRFVLKNNNDEVREYIPFRNLRKRMRLAPHAQSCTGRSSFETNSTPVLRKSFMDRARSGQDKVRS